MSHGPLPGGLPKANPSRRPHLRLTAVCLICCTHADTAAANSEGDLERRESTSDQLPPGGAAAQPGGATPADEQPGAADDQAASTSAGAGVSSTGAASAGASAPAAAASRGGPSGRYRGHLQQQVNPSEEAELRRLESGVGDGFGGSSGADQPASGGGGGFGGSSGGRSRLHQPRQRRHR